MNINEFNKKSDDFILRKQSKLSTEGRNYQLFGGREEITETKLLESEGSTNSAEAKQTAPKMSIIKYKSKGEGKVLNFSIKAKNGSDVVCRDFSYWWLIQESKKSNSYKKHVEENNFAEDTFLTEKEFTKYGILEKSDEIYYCSDSELGNILFHMASQLSEEKPTKYFLLCSHSHATGVVLKLKEKDQTQQIVIKFFDPNEPIHTRVVVEDKHNLQGLSAKDLFGVEDLGLVGYSGNMGDQEFFVALSYDHPEMYQLADRKKPIPKEFWPSEDNNYDALVAPNVFKIQISLQIFDINSLKLSLEALCADQGYTVEGQEYVVAIVSYFFPSNSNSLMTQVVAVLLGTPAEDTIKDFVKLFAMSKFSTDNLCKLLRFDHYTFDYPESLDILKIYLDAIDQYCTLEQKQSLLKQLDYLASHINDAIKDMYLISIGISGV
jgi:hypothetical protein